VCRRRRRLLLADPREQCAPVGIRQPYHVVGESRVDYPFVTPALQPAEREIEMVKLLQLGPDELAMAAGTQYGRDLALV
jgi:hypothetical protein